MKVPLKQIKAALDSSTTRRTVSDLVKSGTRTVRVISEAQVVRLIEVVVEDTLRESGGIDPADRDRVVAQAKSRFDELMRHQAEAEAERQRQAETILALQQCVAGLGREKEQLLATQRQLEQQRDAALLRGATPVERPAAADVVDRTHEGLARLSGELAQVQQWLARLEVVCSSSARDLDSRLEQSMQRLIDRFGREVASATARPVENRVEATDALLGKLLDDGSGLESNIQEIVVVERKSGHSIERSLERLRHTRKGSAAAAHNGSKGTTATRERRRGPPERRTGPQTARAEGTERRKGPKERRTR
jgi:chromosome segregation ATPase